jgi:hypothetical protein
MQLYGTPGWGSAIVEAMLALVGESYEFVDVEGFDRPGGAQEFLAAVNSLRQVPTLVLDDGELLRLGASTTTANPHKTAGRDYSVGGLTGSRPANRAQAPRPMSPAASL